MRKNEILKITICAVMAAVAIVLERFVSLDLGMGLKLTFYGFPLMLVGILFGFKMGTLTGLVSGTILQLTSPYGVSLTSIFWALAPIGWGSISGLINIFFKKSDKFWCLLIVVLITSISATLLNTIAMIMEGLIKGDEYYALASVLTNLPIRLLSMIILVIPYTLLIKAIKKINYNFEN